MSISLKVRGDAESRNLEVHYLPAKINGDGSTDVSKYFSSYTRVGQGNLLTNAIRGFPLNGEIVKIPTTHSSYVLQETEFSNTEKSRNIYVTGSFSNFYYWNYDKIPSNGDAYKQALYLFNISKEFSEPVSETDIQIEIEKRRKI
ncbi:uncharacterized protein LOC126755215 [Bactrocera neohumeralis]|uniref:uncharacterized protein LOC120772468 n=1 Tax=Bactrocera tryoni TaxID=59916 RepID=UPI001A9567CB|nr:uncharacterized protein LOC120772468 [Bactrocera tryoni]XP_050323570.1 uncharacterized protein LOC126755215 [Bactrocera neohumeralis]